jgi:endonuclease YncB( thermonuclease family)
MSQNIVQPSILRHYKGTLKVQGKIPFNQFYYQGGDSDADTIHVVVESMEFKANDQEKPNEVFDTFKGATIRGNKVVKRGNKITVRLQGVDAPELHLELMHKRGEKFPSEQEKKWKALTSDKRYRQHWGARAVKELEDFLKPYVQSGDIDTYVLTNVDYPNDVFDMYGRFIGDIFIAKDDININQWLVEQGWAFQTFYESMNEQEIYKIDAKGMLAKKNLKGIWSIGNGYSDKLVNFDFDLYIPRNKKGVHRVKSNTDKGKINLPKIFRRQVDYKVRTKSGVIDESFVGYLKTRDDKCCLAKDVLGDSGDKATIRRLYEFIDEKGNIKFQPNELIFIEDSSERLKDSTGKPIQDWS